VIAGCCVWKEIQSRMNELQHGSICNFSVIVCHLLHTYHKHERMNEWVTACVSHHFELMSSLPLTQFVSRLQFATKHKNTTRRQGYPNNIKRQRHNKQGYKRIFKVLHSKSLTAEGLTSWPTFIQQSCIVNTGGVFSATSFWNLKFRNDPNT